MWQEAGFLDLADQVDRLVEKLRAPLDRGEGVRAPEIKDKVREILGKHAIFERNPEGLNRGIKEIEMIKEQKLPRMSTRTKTKAFNREWLDALEAENMVSVAEMTLRAALLREESRGLHERVDFPEADPKWLKHTIIEKMDNHLSFSFEPVTFPYVKPE